MFTSFKQLESSCQLIKMHHDTELARRESWSHHASWILSLHFELHDAFRFSMFSTDCEDKFAFAFVELTLVESWFESQVHSQEHIQVHSQAHVSLKYIWTQGTREVVHCDSFDPNSEPDQETRA